VSRLHAGHRSLAASFVTLGLVYGVWYAYSLFLVALLQEFGWSRSLLAGAFSLFALVHGLVSPVLGWLCNRVAPRWVIASGGLLLATGLVLDGAIARPWQLYAAFGLVTALGVAMAGWLPAVVVVQRWFPRRLGLALGLAGSGVGVGIFLVVPLCQLLIEHLGWRWAFRTIGVLVLLWVIPAALLLVREPPAAAARSRAAGTRGLGDTARRPAFWLLASSFFLGGLASQSLLVHQGAYLVDQGLSALVAASVVSVVGLTSVLGKTGWGWLSDRLGREPVHSLGIVLIVASIGALGLVALGWGAPAAYAYGALVGVGYAATSSLAPAIVGDRFGGARFASIFGVLQVFPPLGGALGPWVAGRIFDATRSYRLAFLGVLGAALAATLALWLARWFDRRAAVEPA
jgi:MFS family permease